MPHASLAGLPIAAAAAATTTGTGCRPARRRRRPRPCPRPQPLLCSAPFGGDAGGDGGGGGGGSRRRPRRVASLRPARPAALSVVASLIFSVGGCAVAAAAAAAAATPAAFCFPPPSSSSSSSSSKGEASSSGSVRPVQGWRLHRRSSAAVSVSALGSSSSSGSGLEGGAYRSGRGDCPDRRRPAVRRGARISGGSGSSSSSRRSNTGSGSGSSSSSSGCCRLGASLSPRGPPHPRGSNSGSEDGAHTNRSVLRRRGAAAAAAAAAAASGTAAAAGIAGAAGGTSRAGRRGAAGGARLSSAVEHSEDLGSVEEQLEYRRQAGWVEGWEDQNNGVAGAVGQKVGQKAGALGAVSLSDSDARRLQELAEAAAAGGGLPERNPRATAQLRRACGDPLFFEHLKESIGDRQRDGKKFLTHEEEMDLGTKVQRYRRLTEEKEAMTKTLGRKPILQEVEEASGLSREMYGGVMLDGMEARQRLVVSNLALVVSLASKYKRKNYDCSCLQTLVQEGTLGLIRAAERYDPDKGFRFTTYAIWWIEAKLRVSVQTEERMIHVPMWVKDKYKVVARSVPGLRKSLGRDPTAEELADQVFIDTDSKVEVSSERVDQLRSWVSVHKHHISLDVRMKLSSPGSDDNLTKEDSIVAKDPSAEVTSDWEIRRKFLESCLAQDLTNVQQKIVRMRVGLDGGKRKNRREISRALKIPLESVVGEERKAFNKLGIFRGHGSPTFGDFT